MIFASSWDDGHPADARVAELLGKFGLRGTFYLPMRNREGRKVMDAAAARKLAKDFEIGSHTLDHEYLNRLSQQEIDGQVLDGKRELEELLSRRVDTFCYPGGKVNRSIIRSVVRAGFESARTIDNLRFDVGTDPHRIPTTVQFFPHPRMTILRNFLRRGAYGARAPAFLDLMSEVDWTKAMRELLKSCARRDGVFHLWGHSWEMESLDLWRPLEEFLSAVADLHPTPAAVSQLASAMSPARRV